MPGVSTTTRPCFSSGLGTVISTRSTCLALRGLPASLTQSGRLSIGTGWVVGGAPSSPRRRTDAPASSP